MITATALTEIRDDHTNDMLKVTYALADLSGTVRYGLVICDGLRDIRDRAPHMTAYLNLPKADWLKVCDSLRDKFNITFEGIESSRVSVGLKMERKVPILVTDFWIGVDYMGRECSWSEAARYLMTLCDAVNAELRRYDAEDSVV